MQSRSREDVHHALGRDRARHDLPNGQIQLFLSLSFTWRVFGEYRAHRLKKGNVVAYAQRLLVRHCERKRPREIAYDFHQPLPTLL